MFVDYQKFHFDSEFKKNFLRKKYSNSSLSNHETTETEKNKTRPQSCIPKIKGQIDFKK